MNRAAPLFVLALLAMLAACGGGGGGNGGGTPVDPTILQDRTAYATGATASLASASEQAVDTEHSLTLADGSTLAYRARVGHLTAGSSGAPQASLFYVAYSAAAGAAVRPVVFFYNGGPGSASVWLHLGSWGPRRLVTNNPGTDIPLPFSLVDNPQTLLAVADLVFVDAVGTGFSQAVAPATNASFWGVDSDAEVFAGFVVRYLASVQRPAATTPVVLYGESYGGIRTPIVAQQLLAAGVALQGLVLQSPILNYNSNCGVLAPGRISCGSFIPSYGATAAWFQLARPQPASLMPFVQAVADFTAARYEPAARRWIAQQQPLGDALDQQLADFTGLAATDWLAAPLLPPDSFRTLLKPQQLLGRYDARVVAAVGSTLARDGDPSSTVINAPFKDAIAATLTALKYQAAVPYAMGNDAAINQWTWQHDGNALPDAIPDLALALALKPTLRVLAVEGVHDLATPFRQTELDLARLDDGGTVQAKRYVGGHMTYLDDTVRPALAADLNTFVKALTP